MSGYRRQFVDGRYGQIHLRISEPKIEEAIPLLCLHMFPQSGRNFEKLLEEIGKDRVVIAPDFPGYGESDPPSTPITAGDYADSIWDVVEQLSLVKDDNKIDFFGIHAGSKLATECAYRHPSHVRKLVLMSAAILFPEEIARMKNSLSHIKLDQQGSRFQQFWDMLLKNQAPDATLELAAKSFAEMVRSGESYSWGHRAVFEYNSDFPQRLSELSQPIALLNPEDDLYEMTPRTLEYIQYGKMIDLPGWNHGFLETRSKALAEIIRNFLDSENESLVAEA